MSDYYLDTAARVADLPLFRRRDPETSKAAGRAAARFLSDHERMILAALELGPGTKDELAARCGLTEQQVVRRRAKLQRDGLIVLTGETRATPSGGRAEVWRVA